MAKRPASNVQRQDMTALWAGILQRNAPRAHAAGYVDEALNVAFVGGTPISRPALRPFNGAATAGPIRGMKWHVRSTNERQLLIASADGKQIQRCVLGGDPIDCPLTLMPSTQRSRVPVERVNFLTVSAGAECTVIYDGVNPTMKWDGANLTAFGIVTPPAVHPPTSGEITTSGGFTTTGRHFFAQSLVSPTHESDLTIVDNWYKKDLGANWQLPFHSPTNTAGGDIDDPQVTKWRLYATVAGGSVMRFAGEADIGSDIVFSMSDDTLSGNDPAELLVNGPPPAPAVALAEHRGQVAGVFADDLNLVRFSYFDPNYEVTEGWPESFVIPVAHGDGDELTALVSFSNWLLCFKQNGAFGIIGDTFETYGVVPMLAAGGGQRIGIGANGPGVILPVENALIFAARDGIYRLDRYERAMELRGLQAIRLSGAIDNLYRATRFSLGAATAFDRKRRVFVFFGHG